MYTRKKIRRISFQRRAYPPKEIYNELISLLNDERSACYIGGTLCLPMKPDDNVLLNISDKELPLSIRYLLSKLYVKHKPLNAAFYKQAEEIISKIESKAQHFPSIQKVVSFQKSI
jgi:hypothetical protein